MRETKGDIRGSDLMNESLSLCSSSSQGKFKQKHHIVNSERRVSLGKINFCVVSPHDLTSRQLSHAIHFWSYRSNARSTSNWSVWTSSSNGNIKNLITSAPLYHLAFKFTFFPISFLPTSQQINGVTNLVCPGNGIQPRPEYTHRYFGWRDYYHSIWG